MAFPGLYHWHTGPEPSGRGLLGQAVQPGSSGVHDWQSANIFWHPDCDVSALQAPTYSELTVVGLGPQQAGVLEASNRSWQHQLVELPRQPMQSHLPLESRSPRQLAQLPETIQYPCVHFESHAFPAVLDFFAVPFFFVDQPLLVAMRPTPSPSMAMLRRRHTRLQRVILRNVVNVFLWLGGWPALSHGDHPTRVMIFAKRPGENGAKQALQHKPALLQLNSPLFHRPTGRCWTTMAFTAVTGVT